jgi:predicted transcriptional regulator
MRISDDFVMHMNISHEATASFWGEYDGDGAGGVQRAGDVNGDGYDDMIIGASKNDDAGNDSGKIYIIFGKSSDWEMDVNLSKADASFLGEAPDSQGNSTLRVAGAGDVNGDGCDDILIANPRNDKHGRNAGLTYLIFGKETGWTNNTNLSSSDASFYGEAKSDFSGFYVAGAGDVNSDGYDDILIGALHNDEGGGHAGQSYLILGKDTSWGLDTNLSNSDASFWGENPTDGASKVMGVGDVNGDGFDDFIISSKKNDEGGNDAGQTYLILGKGTGWSMDRSLSTADASFIGEDAGDSSGILMAGAGDVNGDGYDDFLIISHSNSEGGLGAGQTYLILGKASGWSMDTDLSDVDASFLGENANDGSGNINAGAGDVNSDGYDDIVISARGSDDGWIDSGQTYLILGKKDGWSMDTNLSEAEASFLGENPGDSIGRCTGVGDVNGDGFDDIMIGSGSNDENGDNAGQVYLILGINLGYLYLNSPTVTPSSGNTSSEFNFTAIYLHTKNKAPTYVKVNIAGINYSMLEVDLADTNYTNGKDYYFKINDLDIGVYPYNFFASKGSRKISTPSTKLLEVLNTPPEIITQDNLTAVEDTYYEVTYVFGDIDINNVDQSCNWNFSTNASWLKFTTGQDSECATLSGTPTNDDVGQYWVNIAVFDTFETVNTNFTLTVIDTNDFPVIVTTDVTSVFEDMLYKVDYESTDVDGNYEHEWHFTTNASWLSISKDFGVLSGLPVNEDVGFYYANVTVTDVRGGEDSHNFTIEVINTNDPPFWTSVPDSTQVAENESFSFFIQAGDVDKHDTIKYNMNHDAPFEISFEKKTGTIKGRAVLETFYSSPLMVEVDISVTDGDITIRERFDIEIIPNPRPSVQLVSPLDDERVSANSAVIEWFGFDEDNEKLTYDVYLSENLIGVSGLRESTLLLHNSELTTYAISTAKPGEIYYWTVIPFDGLNYGECVEEVFSFIINSPPQIPDISGQEVSAGTKYDFDVNAKDYNLDDVPNFEYGIVEGPEGLTINNETGMISWNTEKELLGTFTVTIWVTDGYDKTNATFTIDVTEQAIIEPSSKDNIVIYVGVSLLLIIISIFIAVTEVARYKFLPMFVAPLYNKLDQDKVLYNFLRGEIYGYIKAKPGVNYNALMHELGLNNGTLAHHARILEKEGYIKSTRDRFHTRFYVAGTQIPEPSTLHQEMLDIIREQPGITQKEIAEIAETSQQVVSYNLKKFIRNDLIIVEEDGRGNRYFIKEPEISGPGLEAR